MLMLQLSERAEGFMDYLRLFSWWAAILFVFFLGVLVTLSITGVLFKYVCTPKETYVDAVTWDGKSVDYPDVARERFRHWSTRGTPATDGAQLALFAEEQ